MAEPNQHNIDPNQIKRNQPTTKEIPQPNTCKKQHQLTPSPPQTHTHTSPFPHEAGKEKEEEEEGKKKRRRRRGGEKKRTTPTFLEDNHRTKVADLNF